MTTLAPEHLPNTLAHAFLLESGTKVTVFRAIPGNGAPRMQMQVPGGSPVDCGAIEAPERFGAYRTPAEFINWVKAFATRA